VFVSGFWVVSRISNSKGFAGIIAAEKFAAGGVQKHGSGDSYPDRYSSLLMMVVTVRFTGMCHFFCMYDAGLKFDVYPSPNSTDRSLSHHRVFVVSEKFTVNPLGLQV
jgi:hypothetical protein